MTTTAPVSLTKTYTACAHGRRADTCTRHTSRPRILAAMALSLSAVVLTGTGAHAATVPASEASTRHAAGIPSAARYMPGSAVMVSPDVRCFTARARIVVKIDGHRVPRGHRIGYCTDGFVESYTWEGSTTIRPAN
jgi:hypothetical protein